MFHKFDTEFTSGKMIREFSFSNFVRDILCAGACVWMCQKINTLTKSFLIWNSVFEVCGKWKLIEIKGKWHNNTGGKLMSVNFLSKYIVGSQGMLQLGGLVPVLWH